ncbi:hypothetical protein [Gemmiger sp.]|uniref:hypothetical protein n=1 Tax=Gemmiger sp. TaxID=2049027 RepID=UPI003A8EA40D
MKKQLVSILFALCMVLCLVPLAAFAEESTETPPECSCETACTAESMNTDCPVCGAEGALPENCAQCAQPADDAAAQPEEKVSDPQPEGKVSDPQPETALTALSGEGETPAASGAVTEVGNEPDLTAAIANSNVNTVKLTANIDISSSLTVDRIVTLDLNGQVLKYVGESKGSVIVVEDGGNLTLMDSNDEKVHNFDKSVMPWALAADDATGENIVAVPGGVITGGTGYPYQLSSTVNCGGGVYIAPGGQLTMTGGNIIGCSAKYGGGVCIYPKQDSKQGQFSMSGGSIIGCSAESGGGVCAFGKFQMLGSAVIRSCTAEGTSFYFGGGVWVDGSFEMSGEAIIEGCQAISEYAYGGGVYVNSSSSFVMSGKAKIERCQAISTPSSPSKGGGVHLANNTTLTLSGSAVIQNCTATNSANSGEAYGGGVSAANVREITLADSASIASCTAANGSGLYITGSSWDPNVYGQLYANGGLVDGDVVLGEANNPCTVIGSGETVFNGKVTVTPGSTIEKGTFNGEVINNGTITGGTFNGTVNNNGTINNGTFNGEVTNNGTINDGTFNTPITGSGTKDDPYQISTAAQLKRFRNIVNGTGGQTQDSGACAVLMNDIVLNDGTFDANGTYTPGSSSKAAEEWTPIGKYTDDNDKTPYTGTFDGQGHTIKGLYVNSASDAYVGLFGCLEGAAVRNLTVDGYVQGYKTAGGIAGYASNAAIENCSNHCSVFGGSDSMLGGIAGLNFYGAKIIDCYNVGTIIRNSTVFEFCGGIVWGNAGTVSNCYNVGTISGNVYDGEIVGRNSGTVENCYYLAGTNLDAVGQSDSYGKTTKTESKTAAEFADGTLLELLKADRNDSPWDSCQYLATAKMTLPVFKGQGDEHTHNGNWTSNGNGTHSRHCTCNAVETVNCSGGKATCKDKAVCEICKESYGSLDPNNHTDLKHIDAKAATAAAEGNIAYWYCGDCDKYFSDAAAKTEITKAATVTAKLPQPTTPPTATPTAAPTTAPQAAEQPRRTAQPTVQPTAAPTVQPVSTIPATGDTSSPILWAALLLCSGAGLAVTAYKKNKHRS